MRLEDAFLCMVLTARDHPADWLVRLCRDAVAGGADIILLQGSHQEDMVRAVASACREEEALCVVADDAELAVASGASGVHLRAANGSVGIARTIMGVGGIVGVSSKTLDDTRLALEVGADYVVHEGGADSPSAFAAIGRGSGGFLYAGGIESVAVAERIVAAGVFRLCVDADRLNQERITEDMAEYARLLGRSV